MRHSFDGTDQDTHFSHPNDQPWPGPPTHGTAATVRKDATPPGNIPRDPQHPRRPVLRDPTVHPGGTYWWL